MAKSARIGAERLQRRLRRERRARVRKGPESRHDPAPSLPAEGRAGPRRRTASGDGRTSTASGPSPPILRDARAAVACCRGPVMPQHRPPPSERAGCTRSRRRRRLARLLRRSAVAGGEDPLRSLATRAGREQPDPVLAPPAFRRRPTAARGSRGRAGRGSRRRAAASSCCGPMRRRRRPQTLSRRRSRRASIRRTRHARA